MPTKKKMFSFNYLKNKLLYTCINCSVIYISIRYLNYYIIPYFQTLRINLVLILVEIMLGPIRVPFS